MEERRVGGEREGQIGSEISQAGEREKTTRTKKREPGLCTKKKKKKDGGV